MQFCIRKALPSELDVLIRIDNESCVLYEVAGLKIELEDEHPFVLAEATRWREAISQGRAYVAVDSNNQPVGFATFYLVDDQPYLDQLSVHPASMRQGLGTKLLQTVLSWSSDRPLWLTTYSNVPWNRPFYEMHGFVSVDETMCGPELCEILDKQRAVLPAPDERIAMVRRMGSNPSF